MTRLGEALPDTVWGEVLMLEGRDEAGEPARRDADWDAVRAARARMLRDRVRDRAMRDPVVEALGYWAPGYPPAERPAAPPAVRR